MVWLDEPIEIETKGVIVAPQVVRGRRLSADETESLLGDYSESTSPNTIKSIIAEINRQYRKSTPTRRRRESFRIERNPTLVRLLKQPHPDFCQLCGNNFFWKRGRRKKYSEIHHIEALSIGGVDATNNCLVLCANCHRKMHYGDIMLEYLGYKLLVMEADKKTIPVKKNIF